MSATPEQPAPPLKAATSIIQTLRDHGHTAYLAGGCVRDRLLGTKPKDYDVATDAEPKTVRKLFRRTQPVGAAFGVMLVYTPIKDAMPIEVATFRKESGYSDHRRPDQVHFTNAEEDAKRRDFTINALFEDPLSDPPTVIDFVGGQQDLERKTLRAVGDPGERFAEDYLRMLRAVRFAARFDFQLDPQTAAAIRPLAKHLGSIARERIGQEVMMMIDAAAPEKTQQTPGTKEPSIPLAVHRAAELLQSLCLDGPTLNEDHTDAPLSTLKTLSQSAGYAARLLAWCMDRKAVSAQAQAVADKQKELLGAAARWRRALCLTNQVSQDMAQIVKLMARACQWQTLRLAHQKRLLAEPLWPQAMLLLQTQPDDPIAQAIAQASPSLIADGLWPQPLVDGESLIQAGMRPGPSFGRLLTACYDAQLEGRLKTPEEAIAWINEQDQASP